MFRNLHVILGVVVIVGLTVVQSLMSDRFVETNVTAEQRAKLLEQVPENFGEWTGQNLEVDATTRDTAGAVGCINRAYVNRRTNEVVGLWLIVGHARDISVHTPDVCFAGSGFSMRSPTSSLYPFEYPGKRQNADFWTNTFVKEDFSGRELTRVFWAWYNPKQGAPVEWRAETNPRWKFGNSRALFKMYFTSAMRDLSETTEDSAAAKFGREFLPIINGILAQSDIRTPSGTGASSESAE
ncbi:MAG: exosortase-associated EpsI family protein [Pirellulales bacterium]